MLAISPTASWESDWGRADGWDVWLGDQRIAVLCEPRWDDMFWHSYRIMPITADHDLASRLVSRDFWTWSNAQRLTYRSRACDFWVHGTDVIPAGDPCESDRLAFRYLLVPASLPRWWERPHWRCVGERDAAADRPRARHGFGGGSP